MFSRKLQTIISRGQIDYCRKTDYKNNVIIEQIQENAEQIV